MAGRPVDGMPDLVAHLKPSHARPGSPPVVVRRLAYPRGSVPPHLVPYVEAVRAVARLRQQQKEV